MASRDILVLNTTASRAETQQGSDTVVIRGDSGTALSVENSSDVSILSVNTVSSSVDVAGKITATTNVSSSLGSSGSFGRLQATTLVGSAFNLTNTAIDGTISSSGQIAAEISGSFRRGFEFTGTIGHVQSDLHDGQNKMTASFGRIVAISLSGSAANLTNTVLDNTLSSSAQIAADISGSFTSGFEFDNSISGSSTSTGSFGRVDATTLTGDISQMTNLVKTGLVSGSAQIAADITGSFQKGFEFDGHISGSEITTASFANIFATKAIGDISEMYNIYPTDTVSSSAQLASNISESFAKTGFEFTGTISGSATSTGSFDNIFATTIHGDISNITNIFPTNTISGSAQIASDISGSFNKGFEFTGIIDGKLKSWSFGTPMIQGAQENAAWGTKNCALVASGYLENGAITTTNSTQEFNGTNWAYGGDIITGRTCAAAFGISTEAAFMTGGSSDDSEEYNGSAWSEANNTITARKGHGGTGTTEAGIVAGGDASPYQQTETFNGTNFSEVNDLITGTFNGFGRMVGTQNAGYYKQPGAGSNTSLCTQEWNGTNWSEVNDSNTQRTGGGGFAGTVNDAWLAGGHPSTPGTTEEWDGTSWANLPASSDLNCIRKYSFGIGLPSVGMQIGGQLNNGPPGYSAISPYADRVVEEFTHSTATGSFGRVEVTSISGDGSNLTNSALAGTFSGSGQLAADISGSFNKGFNVKNNITNVLPVASFGGEQTVGKACWRGASGIQNAGLAFAGCKHPTRITNTETYDGTTFSEVNDMITAGTTVGSGTQNATVAFGGSYRSTCTEEWNGTNWSEVNDLITSRGTVTGPIGLGHSSEAALAAGGVPSTPSVATEEWNGTNWSTSNNLIRGMQCADGFGTPAGGVAYGTSWPSSTPYGADFAQLWNGLNWSEGPILPTPGFERSTNIGAAGAENDGIFAGQCQYQGGFKDQTACYNGITFTVGGALPETRTNHRGAGTNVANAWFVGGIGGSSPYNSSASSSIHITSGVASASFSHIDALRVSASVDEMTNISEPTGTISGSAQIASDISGSFNKGFEFDGEIRTLGAWSAGGDFPGHTNHTNHGALYGTQNAALLGGGMGYYQASKCDTYTYNGTSWSDTGADMIEGRGGYSGIGTQDAALAAGGNCYKSHIWQYLRTDTEEWNGSAWSKTTDLPHQLTFLNNQSAGTQNAGLIAGGFTGTGGANVGSGSEAFQQTSLAWDGLSYTIGASMANERGSGGVVGTMNAALAQGGNNSLGCSTCTEEWNGSAWSDAAASNFKTGFTPTVGTSNNAMHTTDAASPTRTGCSDFYNGMSWSTGPLLGLANYSCTKNCSAAAGSTSAGLFMTQGNSCVEHFDENDATSSLGRVDATELSLESDTDLTVNESLQIPQYATNPPVTGSAGEVWYNTAEEKLYFTYDINSWSSTAELISGGVRGYFGTTGAGLAAGRWNVPAVPAPYTTGISEEWDGNTWTETGDMIHCEQGGTGINNTIGVVNAGLALGHSTSGIRPRVQKWNGSTWTEEDQLTVGCSYGNSLLGSQNAAVSAGGRNGSHGESVCTAEYNGITGFAAADMPTAHAGQSGAGTQNSAYYWGGEQAAPVDSEHLEGLNYNGTSWATGVSHIRSAYDSVSAGTENAALSAGGFHESDGSTEDNGGYTCVEEYNGTSWSVANSLNVAQRGTGGDGSQSSAFAVGKRDGFGMSSESSETEQYTTTGIGCHCIGGV